MESQHSSPKPTIIRRADLRAATGLAPSTVYELIQAGRFPRPIALGPRAVGWVRSELDQWLQSRIAERDGTSDD